MISIRDSKLTLPVAENYPIVMITGGALRHERFAMRMQAEFSDHILAWLQLATAERKVAQDQRSLHSSAKKARALLSKFLARRPDRSPPNTYAESALPQSGSKPSLHTVEQRLFGKEVEKLRETCTLRPIRVESIESEDTTSRINRLKPYFILAFCSPTCISKLRACTEGLVLSQDDARTPEYKVDSSVYWALYHRDLSKITSSIRLWPSGTDGDFVVRSSTPCFAVDDTVESCFARQAALGTELMCEVVGDLIKSRTLRLDGYRKIGGAAMNTEPTLDVRRDVESDLRRGLIQRETARKARF